MAMKLCLDGELAGGLGKYAGLEGCGMHAVVVRAVERYLARREGEAPVSETAMQESVKWHELMKRLR